MTNNEKYERNRVRQRAFEERFVDGRLSEKTRIIMKEMDIVDDISPRIFPWNFMTNLCCFDEEIKQHGSYAILANKRKLSVFLEKWIYSVFGEIPADFDPSNTDRDIRSRMSYKHYINQKTWEIRMSYILKRHYIDQKTWEAVGEEFYVSKERIRQIAMKCLRIMSSPYLRSDGHTRYNSVYYNILPMFFKDKRVPLLNLDMKPEYDPAFPYSAYNGDFNFYCKCLINTEFRHKYFGDKYDDILDDKTRIITATESHVPGDDILDDYSYYEETAIVDKEHNAIRIRINHD